LQSRVSIFLTTCIKRAKDLKPSPRGEVEITDLIKTYLDEGKLSVAKIGRGIAWLDSGTPDSLLDASNFIASIEQRQGLKIGCIEEAAYKAGFIDKKGMKNIIRNMPNSFYRTYLEILIKNAQ
jgi:glucose-1-phosphate thymidylyltransferase